jgi:tRNA pseudouridine32 synthase/23S rRNA pseudouridine746 synthase
LLLFALTPEVQARLQQQFADRQIEKLYQALLEGEPGQRRGRIELPLAKDPNARGRVCVDPNGKWAATEFDYLGERRVLLRPLSGRTHQLRVHCREGLGQPILGDRLYGTAPAPRLHLHACELGFRHPLLNKWIQLKSECPF